MGQHCQIEVGRTATQLYLRVNGYASFHEAAEIIHYLEKLSSGDRPAEYLFDMSNCDKMDSTFMGLLARLASEGQARVSVAHCEGAALQCLDDLGLTQIITMSRGPAQAPESLICLHPGSAARQTREDAIQTGHESLSQISETNQEKFKDVIDAFKKKDSEK